jgi:hypothetical protein
VNAHVGCIHLIALLLGGDSWETGGMGFKQAVRRERYGRERAPDFDKAEAVRVTHVITLVTTSADIHNKTVSKTSKHVRKFCSLWGIGSLRWYPF